MGEKETRLQKEQEVKDQLSKKIAAMESKLLCGGKNIVDHTNEQQRALEQRRQEIAEQKVRYAMSWITLMSSSRHSNRGVRRSLSRRVLLKSFRLTPEWFMGEEWHEDSLEVDDIQRP